MNTLNIGSTLLLMLILASCRANDCVVDLNQSPVSLLGGAQSYSLLEQYEDMRSDSTYHQIEESKQSVPDELFVKRFEVRRSFLGHSGRLEYVFYSRRLAQTRFHPDDPQLFFQAAREKGFPHEIGSELATGDTVFWVAGRRESPETLGASDSRITKSFLACIAAND